MQYKIGYTQNLAQLEMIIYTPYEIYSSGSKYQITRICYSAAKENPELLRSNVKMVIGIIVRLLRDRASVDSSPASKRAIIKKLIKIIGSTTLVFCFDYNSIKTHQTMNVPLIFTVTKALINAETVEDELEEDGITSQG
ncbi:uncharacterized protein OCT59_010224 [Rhizophagus irregularis]|uniref:uncharacterized protein n=1 Tax=Rhizophagus irregularis TaxID=588596 RepID=UPI0033172E3D|nr:hypothetical protein OCT59_010224 [Rhizophagus irregularis]